jgi:hypothetical protein
VPTLLFVEHGVTDRLHAPQDAVPRRLPAQRQETLVGVVSDLLGDLLVQTVLQMDFQRAPS